MGYFSNLVLEVCPGGRRDDSYPSPELQLLWRPEDLKVRMEELTAAGALYRDGLAYRENDLRYVLPGQLGDIYSVEQATELAKRDLLCKYGIDASAPEGQISFEASIFSYTAFFTKENAA